MAARYRFLVVIVLSVLSFSSVRAANATLTQTFFSDTDTNFDFRFTWDGVVAGTTPITATRGAQDAQPGIQ
jgi:hypothetical protein